MSEGGAARRMRAVGGSLHRSASEAMASLLEEAHRQRREEGEGSTSVPQPKRGGPRSPMLPDALQALLHETRPDRRLADVLLPDDTRADVEEFVDEFRKGPLLRDHSLEPRHTVLLVGPPGTGKTSLVGAMANELAMPFLTVRYDGLVGSYLGETANRLQQIVDYASRIPCVLFFDEFESVGKERADAHETGEMKRVVSSLLLHMDAMPTNSIVACATNHPELLDRAVWRRFELTLELPLPADGQLRDWYRETRRSFGPLGMASADFVKTFRGETLSEVEAVTLDARRRHVLSEGALSPAEAFQGALLRWRRRRERNGGAGGERSHGKARSGTGTGAKGAGEASPVPERDLLSGAE